MNKVLSLILAMAVLLACAVYPAAAEGPIFPDMPGGLFENTESTGGIGLMDLLGGLFGGFGNNTVPEEYSDSYSEGIITAFDGTFWESGDLKMEICYQDGYYKVAILEDGTELSYLCVYDEVIEDDTGYGRLTGIGTGDPDTNETQADHGQGVFIWNYFTEEITWQRESGEIVFTRIIDPLDGSKWVGNGKILTIYWLGDANYDLTIEQQTSITTWHYQCVLNGETDTLEGIGEKTEFSTPVYDGANAVFALNETRTALTWTDDKEPDAAEGLALEAVARDLTDATWRSGNLVLFILQPDGFGRYDLNVFEATMDEEIPETEEESEDASDEIEQTVHRYLCTYDWETSTFTSISVSGIDPDTLNYYMDLQEYSGSATFVLEDDNHIIWRDDSGLTGDGVVLEREGY